MPFLRKLSRPGLAPSMGMRRWDPGHGCAHVNNTLAHPLSTILPSASSNQVSLCSVPNSLLSCGSLSGSAHCCRQSPHDVTTSLKPTRNGNKPLTHEPSEDVSSPKLQKRRDGIASSPCDSKCGHLRGGSLCSTDILVSPESQSANRISSCFSSEHMHCRALLLSESCQPRAAFIMTCGTHR